MFSVTVPRLCVITLPTKAMPHLLHESSPLLSCLSSSCVLLIFFLYLSSLLVHSALCFFPWPLAVQYCVASHLLLTQDHILHFLSCYILQLLEFHNFFFFLLPIVNTFQMTNTLNYEPGAARLMTGAFYHLHDTQGSLVAIARQIRICIIARKNIVVTVARYTRTSTKPQNNVNSTFGAMV